VSVHARAPTRIDFAGGWTDVPAYAEREGGAVVNAAISLHVHADFLLGDNRIRLVAEDLGERISLASSRDIRYDGKLDVHKAALNMLPVTGGIEILSRSDAPSGSGLGASGALDVALLAGLARCRREEFAAEDVAEMAFELETAELGLLGGRQDQYASALGGFHLLTLHRGIELKALAVAPDQVRDLERHVVLLHTGHSHFSSATHARVWAAYDRREPAVTDALATIRRLADDAATACEACDWRSLAAIVDENWRQQQRLDATISAPRAQEIERAVRAEGAWGLKATGAGAGGCVAVIAPPDRREAIERAAQRAGASVLPFGFSHEGVVVWEEASAPGLA
jgi:D-glycero-alpha-D-manno-heptose-7-phosphate kinase